MNRRYQGVVAGLGFATILCAPAMALAQSLGAAGSFAVQGAAGVTAAGGAGTVITGDVGASPTPSITGFPPAIVVLPYGLHSNDAAAIAAQGADVALFTALSSGPCTDTVGAQMSGVNFGPGIHCFSSAADLASNGTMAPGWQRLQHLPRGKLTDRERRVHGVVRRRGRVQRLLAGDVRAATLNGVNFVGNVVAQAGVTLGVNASLGGRALATVGPVTLSGTNIIGGCSSLTPAAGGTGGTPAPPGIPPVPTLSVWAMLGLTLLLALAGFTAMRRGTR